MRRAKVFGIGLNKTGTRSLATAMRRIGYRTLHKGDASSSALVHRAAEAGMPLLTYLGEQFDAYFDVEAIVNSYALLDQQYPGSQFILTTRQVDSWLNSREKHVTANQARAARGEYDGRWLTIDRAAWQAEWERHHLDVQSYFAGRPESLLIINVAAGDGWGPLCSFLGVREPRAAFPWQNHQGEGTYASLSHAARTNRVSRAAWHGLRRRIKFGR